jgi:signal transduction histidine kinase
MPRPPHSSDPVPSDAARDAADTEVSRSAASRERGDRRGGRVVGHVGSGVPPHGDRRARPRAPADVAPALPITPAELWDALDAVSDPLFVVDRHWRIRFLNLAAASAASVDRDQALGELFWRIHRSLGNGDLHERLADAMRDRRAVRVEAFAPSRGHWVVATALPTRDGLLVYQHTADEPSISEDARHALQAERAARAEAEAQREQAERLAAELQTAREVADGVRRAAERARVDAESAARAKSDFLATMSHELRTPINAITGYTQLLELGVAGPVTDAQRSYLSRLYASGRHLLGLVDDVLDLANIERGRMTITRDRLTTGAVVAAALALITPDAAARSIRLVDEREGDVGLPFIGDEHRVRQILLNLLSNAVKFTPPGGTVAVGCDRLVRREGDPDDRVPAGEWVCISVRDTGIGIAPEQLGAIFEPFTQADSTRTRTAGGTGLGLALSRRLARLMGGELSVDSRPGEGSTFMLLLPAAPAAPATETTDRATTDRASGAEPSETAATRTVWMGPTLAELGARLREQLEAIIAAFVSRLRADPAFGPSRALSRAQLEDHTLSMLGAIVQSLAIAQASGGLEGELLRDGSAIQEHIAFQHGAQRFRLGWSESLIVREYAILADEVLGRAQGIVPHVEEAAARALGVLARLLDRAQEMTVRGFQHAQRFAHP